LEKTSAFTAGIQVTDGFIDRFGAERVIDTPMCRVGDCGGGVWGGAYGMRPVAGVCREMPWTFLHSAADHHRRRRSPPINALRHHY